MTREPRCSFCDVQGLSHISTVPLNQLLICHCLNCGAIHGVVPNLQERSNFNNRMHSNSWRVNRAPRIMVTGGQELTQEISYLAHLLGQEIILREYILTSNGSIGVDTATAEGAGMTCLSRGIDPHLFIHVFRPINDPVPNFNFGILQIVGQNHDERRDYVIQYSDLIVLLGGGSGTKSVAHHAEAFGKPVIPIGVGSSHIAAVELWQQVFNESTKSDFMKYGLSEEDWERIGPRQQNLKSIVESAINIAEKCFQHCRTS